MIDLDITKTVDSSPTRVNELHNSKNPLSWITYWSIWNVPQPKRSSHWFSWKRWVWTYDHHSIWINNWVGEQNRRSFFVALIVIMIQFFLGIMLTYRRLDTNNQFPAYLILLLILSAISQMFILPIIIGIFLFQWYLVIIIE